MHSPESGSALVSNDTKGTLPCQYNFSSLDSWSVFGAFSGTGFLGLGCVSVDKVNDMVKVDLDVS